jgi:hypothetical protein
MMLIAQAAAEAGGLWLAALLFGTVGVAIGWLRALPLLGSTSPDGGSTQRSFPPQAPIRLLTWVLVAAQLLIFVFSVLAGG